MNDDIVNENIHFKEVLVIGPNGEQLGTMMRREALEKAYEYNLDLMFAEIEKRIRNGIR